MDEALRFFRTNEICIYFFLLLGALLYLRKFVVSWRGLRSAIYRIERENAQNRLNRAASVLVLLILMAITEFVVVSFIAPLRPESNLLLTPTLDILATTTVAMSPQIVESMDGTPIPTNVVPTPTIDARIGSCVASKVEITAPNPDQQISGEVVIEGWADAPNFGFYKLEVISRQEGSNWQTIQAGREVVQDGILVEKWDTTSFSEGQYLLRLVVEDSSGQPLPDCRVPVGIVRP